MVAEFMNVRDRYLATMRFERCPRTPRWEMGFWSGAIRRWHEEGLPGQQQAIRAAEPYGGWVSGPGHNPAGVDISSRDHDVAEYFVMDEGAMAVSINYNVWPPFEVVVLEQTDEYSIVRGPDGVTNKNLEGEHGGTMPLWLDYPVHSRQEWERFVAERYQPDLSRRIPPDWNELVTEYNGPRSYPICLGAGFTGFFGTIRQWLGLERTLTTFYDDPVWMHAMMDYLADFYVKLYGEVLSQVKVDYCLHWEDMCYVAGPLISPRMFAEFMVEPYKRLSGMLRDNGVDVLMVDTDGDCRSLIPLFVEGGVTSLLPFEAQSHMHVAEVRTQYPHLGMQGGIDKKALASGKAAIDQELDEKVPVVLSGGYIPGVDHGVPPDVSWENFRYYRRKLDEMLDEYDAQRWNAATDGSA